KESEERLKIFMESAPDTFMLYDSELNLIFINKIGVKRFPRGTKKEDIIGKSIIELSLDVKKTGRYDEYMKVLKTGKHFSIEKFIPHPKFGYLHISLNAFKVLNGLGIIARDSTERKKAEQKLEASEKKLRELNDELEKKVIDRTETLKISEQKYKTILDGIVTGVWVADKDDNIYYANKGMGKIAGVPSEQLVNANVLNDFSESTLKYFRPYYLKARNTLKEVYYDSVPVITPAGRQSFQSGWLIPLTKDGKFYSTICTIEDITERKKTEQNLKESEKKLRNLNKKLEEKVEERTKKLKESEQRLKSFMNSATDGFLLFDPNLNYIDVNNVTLQIIGMTKEELIGKNILDIAPNLKETGRYDKFLDVIKTGEPFSTDDAIIKGKNGSSDTPFSLRAFKVGDNLGVIITDITEIKRVELKLREKNIELSVLNKIITLGNESTSLQEFLKKSYDQVLEVVNFDRGGVYLYDPEIHHNKLVLHKNTHPDFIAAVEDVDMSVEPFNIVFDKNKPYYIEDFSKFMEGSKDLGIYSAAIVPLRSKDEYIGSMNVGSNRYQIHSQKDLEILVAIGKQMGIIIQKFESEKLLKESEQRLTSFMNSATDG
ncbi:MAG: PAS domain S-box protein, partial [Candidatus Lokiarchaeota archaeon]|nr:PAS domain S-box protein [Candidatus Lokiarchaeota archaeon]